MYHRIKLIIFTIVLLDYASLNAVATLLPTLLLTTKSSFAQQGAVLLGVIIALYALGQSVGAPIWGRLSDKWGRKPVLQLTVVGNMLGLGIAYIGVVSGHLYIVLSGRLLSGLAAGNVAVGLSVMSDISTTQVKAVNYRIMQMAIGLGLIVGPMIVALCSNVLGNTVWTIQMPFLILVLLQASLVPIISYYFSETRDINASSVPDRNKHLQHRELLTTNIRWALLMWTIYIAGLMLFGQFLPSVLHYNFSYDAHAIAMYLLIMGAVYVVCQFWVVTVAARFLSATAMVRLCLGSLSCSVLLFAVVHTQLSLWLLSWCYYGCLALVMPNLYAVISDTALPDQQGYLMGRVSALQGAATIVTSLLGGILLGSDVNMIIVIAAALMALAWLGFFRIQQGENHALV